MKQLTIIIVLVAILAYPIAYKTSEHKKTIKVTDKERITTGSGESISSKFVVYTDKGVFENTDSMLFMKFNSADVQNELKVGQEYRVTVAGWRVPFLSYYKNILEVKPVQ